MPLRLPPELWEQVASHLSPGLTAPLLTESPKTRPTKPSYWHGSLANLCLASRMHHDLATRRLYEFPMTRNTEAFMRTLFARRDLALHVKCLRHATWNNWYDMSTVHDVEEFSDLLMEHTGRLAERINSEESPASYLTDEMGQMVEIASDDDVEPQVNDAVALELVPYLERIHLSSHFMPVCASSLPGSLPKLREVVITNPDMWGMVLVHHLAYLALAAPNISTLRVARMYAGWPRVIFPNVTTLDITDSMMPTDTCEEFHQSFPRLTDYKCELGPAQGGASQARAWLLDTIPRHLPHLERFHYVVEASDERPVDGNPPIDDQEAVYPPALAELKELKYLSVELSSLVDYRLLAEDPKNVLSNVLPASLSHLRVIHTDSDQFPPALLVTVLKALAEIVPGKFPSLKKVTVAGSSVVIPSDVGEAMGAHSITFSEEGAPA